MESKKNGIDPALIEEVHRLLSQLLRKGLDSKEALVIYHTLRGLFAMAGQSDLNLKAQALEENPGSSISQSEFIDSVKERFILSSGSSKPMTLEDLVNVLHPYSQRLAKDLGKKIHPINSHNGQMEIPERYQGILMTVFSHLIRNAIDHGIELPDVRLALGKEEKGSISIFGAQDARVFEFRLQDDGEGFNEEIKLNLFDYGFSTRTTLSEVSGRGIGLHAVKSIVEEFGGEVNVESVKERGTSFIIRLPAP